MTRTGTKPPVLMRPSPGLMFYNARYYDPLLRRFISPDTIVPDSGNPQSLNRYSYVRNNPVNRADPSGHFDYATPKIDGGVRAGTWDDCTANERKVRNEAAEMRSAGYTTKEMAMRWGGRITDNRDMGTSNWDDLLLGPFRFLVFDERECTGSGSAASCATQIAGILPWGKALKLLRFTDELVDGVRLSDEFADGGRHAGDAAGAACSFSGDTEVVMGDGTTKPIAQIKIGDEVVAHDPETGEQGNRRVSHVWVHDDTLVELNIGGEVLVTTEDHPFWNATDKAWQRADILDPGDLVLAIDGTTLPVVGLDWTTTRNDTAYNLTIEDIHTYYVEVGNSTVLVHNVCKPPSVDKTGKIHGELPSHVHDNWSYEDLQQLHDDLEMSIASRQKENMYHGPDRGHSTRVTQEGNLLRQVKRALRDWSD